MTLRNTTAAWGGVAKSFHWIVAALILVQFGLGWVAEQWPRSLAKVELFVWHKSVGVLVLALVVARIGWRLFNPPPAPVPQVSVGERRAARAVHALLYVVIVAMPLSGWVINSAANFPLKVFWLFPLPAIVPPGDALKEVAETVHLTLFWILAALVAAHVAAALRHHFAARDDVLVRMLPGGRPRPGASR
jgi:cytochrome b561